MIMYGTYWYHEKIIQVFRIESQLQLRLRPTVQDPALHRFRSSYGSSTGVLVWQFHGRCIPRVVSEFLIMKMNENKLIHGHRRFELATVSCRLCQFNLKAPHHRSAFPVKGSGI